MTRVAAHDRRQVMCSNRISLGDFGWPGTVGGVETVVEPVPRSGRSPSAVVRTIAGASVAAATQRRLSESDMMPARQRYHCAPGRSQRQRGRHGPSRHPRLRGVKLLIASATVVERATQLRAGVRLLIESASEVWVMSPSLVGPIQWLTGGVDAARQSADQRLKVVLEQLAGQGVAASGREATSWVRRRSMTPLVSSAPITSSSRCHPRRRRRGNATR